MPRFVIEGLRDLEAEMRAIDPKLTRNITVACRPASKDIAQTATGLAPKKTGAMAASIRPVSGPNYFGAKATDPGAGVQEFATDYIRRARGSVQIDHYHHRVLAAGISKSVKKYYKATGKTTASTDEVHMFNVAGPPPRFLFRALDIKGDRLAETVVWPAIVDALKANGWWD